MENVVSDKFHLSIEKLKSSVENVENIPSSACGNSGNAVSDTISCSIQSKYFENIKPKAKDSQEKKEKSKISSALDTYCETDILNESDDFIVPEPVTKVKNSRNEYTNENCKREIISCEICKEDITHLDVHNRAVHVNNCIDKQSTIPPEPEVQTSVNENIFILECPLCFKHFASPELRANHIKKCGKSKGLTLQSIIKALELQERHALERISLGLPAKPLKPVKSHKNAACKKAIVEPKNKAQSDIQLAKALSLSLTNSDKQSEEENNGIIKFVTLKPPDSHQYPGRKPKRTVTPILVLRSEEERKKLLLDKVATIVAPQNSVEEDSPVAAECTPSQKENENLCLIPLLWQLSGKALGKHEYYVESLLDWIQPSDVEAGAKLHHLSQIAGHEIVTQLPCDYTFSSEDTKQENYMKFSDDDSSSPSLIGCLRSLVASSWMSDVDIYTACGSIIPAHRLLLAVRCPTLKQDSDFCSKTGRVSLKWENTPFNVALQFLNFIYTDKIEIQENMKSDMLHLANKYEISELQMLLLANKDIGMQSDVRHSEKISEEFSSKDSTVPYLLSSQNQVSDHEQSPGFEAQDDDNMDLEIVYNCINSSLKPSQLSMNEPLNISPMSSFQPEPNTNSQNSSDSYQNVHMPVSGSPKEHSFEKECSFQKGASPSYVSSTSPVIFDVSDDESEVDMEVDSNNESVELPVNCSQKSVLQECNLDDVELDLCSTKSFSSEDSVKFLESSFPDPPKTPMKGNIGLVSSSPQFPTSFCREDSPSAMVADVSSDSQRTCESNTQKVSEFQEFISGQDTNLELLASNHLKNSFAQHEQEIHSDSEMNVKEISVVGSPDKNTIKNPIFNSDVAQKVHDSSSNMTFSNQISIISTRDDENDLNHPKSFSACEGGLSSQQILKSLIKTSSPCTSEVPSFDYANGSKSLLNNSHERYTSFQIGDDISYSEMKSSFNNELHEKHLKNSLNSKEIRDLDEKNSQNSNTSTFVHSSAPNTLPNCIDNVPVDGKIVFSPEVVLATSVKNDPLNSPFLEKEKYEFQSRISGILLPSENDGSCKLKNLLESSPTHYEPFDDPLECNGYFEQVILSPEEPKEAKLSSSKTTKLMKNSKVTESVTPSSSSHHKFQLIDSPITPFPDYKNMVTPEIKQALRKIGVKALPRKKAVAVLSHVYNETHPLINGETNTENSSEAKPSKTEKLKKRKKPGEKNASQAKRQQIAVNCTNNIDGTQDSDDSSSENPEWQGCVPEISFSQFTQDSPTKSSKDDIDLIKQYIQSNEELYNNILTYSPLNLVAFHQELKNSGIKISIQKLMDFLDEQCITFTCPRKEEHRKKQTARQQRFRKNMIAKLSQQA